MRRFDADVAAGHLLEDPGVYCVENFIPKDMLQRIVALIDEYEVDRYSGVRGLLDKSKDLQSIVLNQDISSTCWNVFGMDFRLGSLDVKVNPPITQADSGQFILRDHVDYPGTNMIGVREGQANHFMGLPMALKVFIPLTDLNEETGATRYIPNSHKWFRNPELHKLEFEMRLENGEGKILKVPAGSLAMWSGPIWHADFKNESSRNRLLLHICLTPMFVATPQNVLASYPDDYKASCSPRMREILGCLD